MSDAIKGMLTVAAAIVGLAVLVTLVSSKSQTAGVLTAGGSALSSALKGALGPILQ